MTIAVRVLLLLDFAGHWCAGAGCPQMFAKRMLA
jgi:hypothetical protein